MGGDICELCLGWDMYVVSRLLGIGESF